MPRIAQLIAAGLIGFAGCRGGSLPVRPATQVPSWTLVDPRVLVIGANDTVRAGVLGRVAGALRLSNGSIVVSDVQPPELKLFDSTGRFVRTVGRTGAGPNEFRWPGPPRRFAGDSFYVIDVEQRRVSIFDREAKQVVTRPFYLKSSEGVFFPIGLVSSAQYVATVTAQRYPSRIGAKIRTPIDIVSGRFDTSGYRHIARGRGDERVGGIWREAGHSSVMGYLVEFGSTTQIAVGSGRIYLGQTAEPRIEMLDQNGQRIRLITWEATPDPVTQADRRARIAQESSFVAGFPSSPDPAQVGSLLENLRSAEMAKYAPVFTGLLPTDDGGLWVEQDPRPWTPSRRYLVFDSLGVQVARMTVPRQLQLYQVASDLVVGRWRDPGEADQVRVYRLLR